MPLNLPSSETFMGELRSKSGLLKMDALSLFLFYFAFFPLFFFFLYFFFNLFLFYFVPFCFVKSLSLVLVNWYFSSVKMVFCKGFTVLHFEVDLKLLMNGGWYTQSMINLFLCCESWINLVLNTCKHLNSTDEHIVSEGWNSEK